MTRVTQPLKDTYIVAHDITEYHLASMLYCVCGAKSDRATETIQHRFFPKVDSVVCGWGEGGFTFKVDRNKIDQSRILTIRDLYKRVSHYHPEELLKRMRSTVLSECILLMSYASTFSNLQKPQKIIVHMGLEVPYLKTIYQNFGSDIFFKAWGRIRQYSRRPNKHIKDIRSVCTMLKESGIEVKSQKELFVLFANHNADCRLGIFHYTNRVKEICLSSEPEDIVAEIDLYLSTAGELSYATKLRIEEVKNRILTTTLKAVT